MIYTEMGNLKNYRGLNGCLDTAIDYLSSHSLDELEAGYYEIDEKRVWLNVYEYETIPQEQGILEGHEKYADIHMIVTGVELTGVSDISRVAVKASNKEADFLVLEGEVEHYMRLVPGKVLVVLPEDVHMVKIAEKEPMAVKKAVIKVYMG